MTNIGGIGHHGSYVGKRAEMGVLDDAWCCDFCAKFDFSTAKIEVDKYSAKILLALCDTKFDKEEQFVYCPKCGRKLV